MAASMPYIVNQSTTLVQFDTSDITISPHIALLSSVNAPGSLITIRDLTGNASATNKIIVSTTQGQSFYNGNNLSSYTITQPYGFITVTPKTTQAWALLNTFAFPDLSAAANINAITAVSITTSTFQGINVTISTALISSLSVNNIYVRENISVGQSTISRTGFFQCTLRAMENMFVANTLYVGSTISTITANVTSTLITPYISATTLDIRGVIRTASTISTNGPLFVGSSISTTANLAVGGSTFIQGELRVLQNATFYSSISTLYALGVGRETQLNSSLSVRDDAIIYKNLSTVLNLNVGGALSINSNLNVMGSTILNKTLLTFGEISSLSNVFINRNLSVAGDIAVGGNLNFGSTVRLTNIIASSLLANFFISTPSSIAVGTSLNVLGSTILTGPVSTLSNLNVAGAFNLQGSGTLNSTLTVLSSISTTGNLTASGVISTLSSLAVGDSLRVARSGFFGNNISTLSSLGVGRSVSIEGTLFVRSTISVIGTAAFYSSVQIQGGLSIFSSLAVAGSTFMQKVGIGGNVPTLDTDPSGNSVVKVTGDLQLTGELRDASGIAFLLTKSGRPLIPGINSEGNVGINRDSNASYQIDVSGNALIRGSLDVSGQANFVNSSNTGTLGIAGHTTLNTLSTTGNVGLGTSFGVDRLTVEGNIAVYRGDITAFASLGFTPSIYSFGYLGSLLDTNVGVNLNVGPTGITSITNTSHNSLVIGGGVRVNSKGISFNPTIGTDTRVNSAPWFGIGWGNKFLGNRGVNSLQIASCNGINFASAGDNQSYGSDMAIVNSRVGIANIDPQATLDVSGTMIVTGLARFINTSNSGTLDVSGATTLSNTSIRGTLDVSGATTLNNTTIRGTLDVSGATTLTNTTIRGTLDVSGATTLSNTTIRGTLGVARSTTLNSNLSTVGQAAFYSSVQIQGGLSVFSTIGTFGLSVLSNTTMGGTLNVRGATTLPGGLTVTGNIKTTPTDAVAIGNNAAQITQGDAAIAIGLQAGSNNQGAFSIAIGSEAAETSQDVGAIAIGYQAGSNNQNNQGIAIGWQAGISNQSTLSIAIGLSAGASNQYENSIAIGTISGQEFQNDFSIALGYGSAQKSQSTHSIAIGRDCGYSNQNDYSIGIGADAARENQARNAIAIGWEAGRIKQSTNAIAIGYQAGANSQGSNAIAIGNGAGLVNQASNSIILNASGSALNNASQQGFFVKPIRNASATQSLKYNITTSEISYIPDSAIEAVSINAPLIYTSSIIASTIRSRNIITDSIISVSSLIQNMYSPFIYNSSLQTSSIMTSTIRIAGEANIIRAGVAIMNLSNTLNVNQLTLVGGVTTAADYSPQSLAGDSVIRSEGTSGLCLSAFTSGGLRIAQTTGIVTASSNLNISGNLEVARQTTLGQALTVNGTVTATKFIGDLSGNASNAYIAENARAILAGANISVTGTLSASGNVNLVNAGGGTFTVGQTGLTTATTLHGGLTVNGLAVTVNNIAIRSNISINLDLDVGGITRLRGELILDTQTANRAATRLVVSNNLVYMMNGIRDASNNIANGSASDFIFSTWGGTTEHLRLTSLGNLGIGIANPSEKLHVNGNANFVNTSNSGTLRVTSNVTLQGSGSGTVTVGSATNQTTAMTVNGTLGVTGEGTFGTLVVNSNVALRGFGGGTVTVGLLGQTTTTMTVNGNLIASGNVTAFSDVRAKENIVTIDSPLDKIMKMRGVYYTRKDLSEPTERHVGVIAQEIEEILPEVVLTDTTENKNKSVAYGNIVAILIEGMKEQQKIIEGHQSTINSLLTRI